MNQKFKNYPRSFERVFTGDELIEKKCSLDEVSTFENSPHPDKYRPLFTKTMREFELVLYDYLVKIIWLMKRFCYRGKRRRGFQLNGVDIDRAFGVFMRHYVGYDNRFIFAANGSLGKIASYFDDFYPDFDVTDPFEGKYEFPYQYMTLECLVLVYQMDERLELLACGEKQKMSLTEFMDYVLNHVSCVNEECGETYLFTYSHTYMPYIKHLRRGKLK